MIKSVVANWHNNKHLIEAELKKKHPDDYKDLVSLVLKHVGELSGWQKLNVDNLVEIDHGHYQGTLLYIVPIDSYQPDDYYFVKVGYGSCSGCDTLQSISRYDDGAPSDDQVKDYMTLALHIV